MAELIGAVMVLAGGFFGGMLRFAVSGAVARRVGEVFPWGTLSVNVAGALAAGALAAAARHSGGIVDVEPVRDLVVVGFLGGFTTVSSFSLQTLTLMLDGEVVRGVMNVLLSAGLCMAAVASGFAAAAHILPAPGL